jgi:hypothetical protein
MPVSAPVGGGVDGPQYADFQDVTDSQQIAGAATSMREKLVLTQDSLVLDIAKFSGDIKSYAAKAEAPIIAPFIKVRTTGPLKAAEQNTEQMQRELSRLIMQLPPKLRALLLRNMRLPRDQRDPHLNGLEKMLKQQIAMQQWAKALLKRFKQRDREDEDEGYRGIFSEEEEEELLPKGTVIPKTRYVPIGKVDQMTMTPEQVEKQIQANSVFLIECQLGILLMQIEGLEVDDPARPLLMEFPKLIQKMLRHSMTFVDLRNVMEYKKARKIAVGLENLGMKHIEEQKTLLERAQQYGADGPSKSIVTYATAVMTICVISCSLLRTNASLSAWQTQGMALLQCHTLSSSPLIGEASMMLFNRIGEGLEAMGVPFDKVKILQLAFLIGSVAMLFLSAQEELPLFMAYDPKEMSTESQNALKAMSVDTEKMRGLAKAASIHLACAATIAVHMAASAVKAIVPKAPEALTAVMLLLVSLASVLEGSALLQRVDESANELYNFLFDKPLAKASKEMQELVDSGKAPRVLEEIISALRLSELTLEKTPILDRLAARETALELHKLGTKLITDGRDDLLRLAALFALETLTYHRQSRQVVPNVNNMI